LPGSEVQGYSSPRALSTNAVNKDWVPTMNPPTTKSHHSSPTKLPTAMPEVGKDLEVPPPMILRPGSFLPGSEVQGSSSPRAVSANAVNKDWVPAINPPTRNSPGLTFLKSSLSGWPSQVSGAQRPQDKGGRSPGSGSRMSAGATAKRHSFNYSLLSNDPLSGFVDSLHPQDVSGKFTNASTSKTIRTSMTMLPAKGNEFKSCGSSKVQLPPPVTKANPADSVSRHQATRNAGGRESSPAPESKRTVDNLTSSTRFFKDRNSSQSDGHSLNGNKNHMSLLNCGMNIHRGGGDANTLKFTRLFDDMSTSSSKKPHPSGDFNFASIFNNVPHNTPHKSTNRCTSSGEHPFLSSVPLGVSSMKFTR